MLKDGDLLDSRGELAQSGYAYSQVKRYDRSKVHGHVRVKERDSYCFGDDRYMIVLTVANNSVNALAAVSVMDFRHFTYNAESTVCLLGGKAPFPSDIRSGDVHFEKKDVKLDFLNDGGTRTISATWKRFSDGDELSCELSLDAPKGDIMVFAAPFEKRKSFYYTAKLNCLSGRGWIRMGDERHEFSNCMGSLDWLRGAGSGNVECYKASLSTDIDGTPFGLNLGTYDLTSTNDNAMLYAGKAHKLGKVKFELSFTNDALDYLKPWKINEENGRLQAIFYPMIDCPKRTQRVIRSRAHRVFGKFYGKATLDDGTIVDIIDKLGYAEHSRSRL